MIVRRMAMRKASPRPLPGASTAIAIPFVLCLPELRGCRSAASRCSRPHGGGHQIVDQLNPMETVTGLQADSRRSTS